MPDRAARDTFSGYPINQLLAVVDKSDDVESTLSDLIEAGFNEDELLAIADGSAAEQKGDGGHPILDHVLLHAASFGSKFDNTHTYEHALEAGGYILTVHTPSAPDRNRAVRILRNHGSHFVNFYGILDVVQILP